MRNTSVIAEHTEFVTVQVTKVGRDRTRILDSCSALESARRFVRRLLDADTEFARGPALAVVDYECMQC